MVSSRYEACTILGIGIGATDADIKNAFKTNVKKYHPDAGQQSDTDKYNQIVEAYEFLTTTKPIQTGKVMGAGVRKSSSYAYGRSSDYKSFEKQIKKQKEEKYKELQKKAKEYDEEQRRRKEEYDRAMAAIDAIKVADAIKAMILANKE